MARLGTPIKAEKKSLRVLRAFVVGSFPLFSLQGNASG
jgi:hypothetical protein